MRDFVGGDRLGDAGARARAQRALCLGHLDRAVDLAPPAERPLVELLARHRNALRWGQTYTAADFGQDFIDNYGWVELFGTRGHFANDRIAAGFLMLGPDIVYPDHHHVAEELYVPLTGGTEWRKGEGGFVARARRRNHPPSVQCQPRHADRRRAAGRALCLARRAAGAEIDDRRRPVATSVCLAAGRTASPEDANGWRARSHRPRLVLPDSLTAPEGVRRFRTRPLIWLRSDLPTPERWC